MSAFSSESLFGLGQGKALHLYLLDPGFNSLWTKVLASILRSYRPHCVSSRELSGTSFNFLEKKAIQFSLNDN